VTDNDKIINFPGSQAKPAPRSTVKAPEDRIYTGPGSGDYATGEPGNLFVPPQNIQLTKDQEKAIATVLGGGAFVCIGIRPVVDGADFITACGGSGTDLRNAQEHLPGVILRLFERKGIL
jgi:hypothetical protein